MSQLKRYLPCILLAFSVSSAMSQTNPQTENQALVQLAGPDVLDVEPFSAVQLARVPGRLARSVILQANKYHVLGNANQSSTLPFGGDEVGHELDPDTFSGFTHYGGLAWERYCAGGLGLVESDIRTLRRVRVQALPLEQYPHCKPPFFSFIQYKTAWLKFCAGQELKMMEQRIVDTVGQANVPTSLIQSCTPWVVDR